MGHFQAWPPKHSCVWPTVFCPFPGLSVDTLEAGRNLGFQMTFWKAAQWSEIHLGDFEWEITRLLCETMELQLALPTRYKVLSIADFSFYQDFLRWILWFAFYIWGNWGLPRASACTVRKLPNWGFLPSLTDFIHIYHYKKKEFIKKQWSLVHVDEPRKCYAEWNKPDTNITWFHTTIILWLYNNW